MPRRQQRRPFRQPRDRGPDQAREQALVDAGARRLLAAHDARSLETLVQELTRMRDQADREATDQPSPDALRTYRRIARELVEAQRAQALL
jgi:hypothetical protein